MPVIMTGSPGGPLGGGSGSAFGSGLGGLSTSPSKLFTPNLEVWTRRAEEDRQMVDERKAEYDSMRNMRLAMVSEQNRQGTDKKKKAKDDFAARQKARLEAEAAEKERLKQWRLESLEKNKVDHKMDMREGEPGYGPTRWCWPTAHHHPRMCASGVDVAVDFVLGPGALLAASASAAGESGSPQTGDSEMLSLAEKLPNHLQEMKLREAAVRAQMAEEDAEAASLARNEREAEAKAMRIELAAKAEAKKAAEVARAVRIKKEMAQATRTGAKQQAERDRVRYEKSMADRAENVRRLQMDTRLRDDIEIANERPEGSSMSKGGKAEFIEQVKAGTYDE